MGKSMPVYTVSATGRDGRKRHVHRTGANSPFAGSAESWRESAKKLKG